MSASSIHDRYPSTIITNPYNAGSTRLLVPIALTDADYTATVGDLKGALFTMTPGADRVLTLPTAALVVAQTPNAGISQTYEFIVRSLAAHNITVTPGTGGTTSGTMTVNNTVKRFGLRISDVTPAAEAYVIYSLSA